MRKEISRISSALKLGVLDEICIQNIQEVLSSGDSIALKSIRELVEAENWAELRNRFYQYLEFGTGGMRGRVIGEIITKAERGNAKEGVPEFPCVGTATLNFFILRRVMLAFLLVLQEKKKEGKICFAIAHDTRYFSQKFTQFCANFGKDYGAEVFLFDGATSTPQLSHFVCQSDMNAGIVLTASHNPSYDNGFKVYFEDGGQAVEKKIAPLIAHFQKGDCPEKREGGGIFLLGKKEEEEYLSVLQNLILNPSLFEGEKISLVYSSLHGTGKRIIPSLLKRVGCEVFSVTSQEVEDGGFSTVISPNPESDEAFQETVDLMEEKKADVGIATDPDCDRLGAASRDRNGMIRLLSGNQIGLLLLWYRLEILSQREDWKEKNPIFITTYVTSPLQKKIAKSYGCRVIETLTGFKYIGAKIQKYEEEDAPPFFVFGSEESYGFLATSAVRDKDGNGAAILIAELALFAKKQKKTYWCLLDEIYQKYGYFQERTFSLQFKGAEGNLEREKLFQSFLADSPNFGYKILSFENFEEEIKDADGEILPKAKMYLYRLENGFSCIIRPSGTEPKMKFYFFASGISQEGVERVLEKLEKKLLVRYGKG